MILMANKIGALLISLKLDLSISLKSRAILRKINLYFSTSFPIEYNKSRDDFTNNSAKSIGDGSFLTPQLCRNLLALSPKSTHEKKSFKLKKYIYSLKKKNKTYDLSKGNKVQYLSS